MSGKNILVLSLFPFSSLNLYLLYHPELHLNMYEGVMKTPLIQRFFLGEVDSLLMVLSKSSLSLNVLFSRPWITINLASTPFLFSLRFPWLLFGFSMFLWVVSQGKSSSHLNWEISHSCFLVQSLTRINLKDRQVLGLA